MRCYAGMRTTLVAYRTGGRDFRKRATNEIAAKQIEEYWGGQGYQVRTDVVDYTETLFGITSDMIAGLPEELFYERITDIKRRGG
jgi:hypothetical protein